MPLTQIRNSNIDSSAQYTGFKNRIINGDMRIDQRNAGASVALAASVYPVDRFRIGKDTAGVSGTTQQSTTVPASATFSKSVSISVTTGAAAASGDDNFLWQPIEGNNFADFGYGTAGAQALTLSFWVRSSITGTYGVALSNSAGNRCYMATYTVNVANTWEQKSITIAGDTTGTWLTDNGIGLRLLWDLGCGTGRSIAASSSWGSSYGTGLTGGVKLFANTGATFYITGVQLEKGSAATSFDYRPYGTELALCQRYGLRVEQQQNSGDVCGSAAACNVKFQFPVTMRTTPTASFTTAGSWIVGNGYSANYTASSASIAASALTPQGGRVFISGFPGFGSNFFVSGTDAAGTAVMFMSAEL